MRRPAGAGGLTPQQLAMARAVARYRTDRPAAIASFQQAANVGTPTERQGRLIIRGGTTWPALWIYAEMAAQLDTMRDRPQGAQDYVHTGRFDTRRFLTEAEAGLRANRATAVKFHAGSLPNFERFLNFMAADPRIIDVRWMAYMFGTAYWEAAETFTAGHRANGRAIRQWRTVIPIDETGAGEQRLYARPVKVERLAATRGRITEWDGEQFEITERGYSVPRGQAGGAIYANPAHPHYTAAPGDEHVYFGRGYVQLTWWYHYAMAGVAIGRGFDLLFDPELAKGPDIAYRVMIDGMVTGRHYANGRRIQNYIYGTLANYTGARAIVIGADPQPTIVEATRVFETALLAARL